MTAREVRADAGTSALGVGGGPYGENRYSPAANRPVINPPPGLAGHVGPALRRDGRFSGERGRTESSAPTNWWALPGGVRAEQRPAPTSGLLLPFTIHPALAVIVTALRAAGASDGPRGTSGCRNQCPWGRRRPLRRESIPACGQPACYQSAAGVGGTRRSRPTEGWQVFGGTGADRVVRPYEGAMFCRTLVENCPLIRPSLRTGAPSPQGEGGVRAEQRRRRFGHSPPRGRRGGFSPAAALQAKTAPVGERFCFVV